MPHVFISYARDDKVVIDKLVCDLQSHGVEVWLDRNRISVGARWKDAIASAIREGNFFLACFSHNFNASNRGYRYEELRLACDLLSRLPQNTSWFLPVFLDEAGIPDWQFPGSEHLAEIQNVSLDQNWGAGVVKLLDAIGFSVGERVKVIWDVYGEICFDGIVCEKPTDWTFVRYDGGAADYVPNKWIQEGERHIGASVKVKWWDEEIYHAMIEPPADGQYFVKLDDGREAFFPRKEIKRL